MQTEVDMEVHQKLGPCCSCGRDDPKHPARNVLMLQQKSPIPGRGWGCVQCGLPADGAVAVVCDECLQANRPRQFACRGWPGVDGRVAIGELVGSHQHDLSKHPEHHAQEHAVPTCSDCGCTDEAGCPGGCVWVLPDLCSVCARRRLLAAGMERRAGVAVPIEWLASVMLQLALTAEGCGCALEGRPVAGMADEMAQDYERFAKAGNAPTGGELLLSISEPADAERVLVEPKLWQPGDPL